MPRLKMQNPRRLAVTLAGEAVRDVERLRALLPLDGEEEPSAAAIIRFALRVTLDGVAVGFLVTAGKAGQNAMLEKLQSLEGIDPDKLDERRAKQREAQLGYVLERYATAEMG